MGVGYDSIAAAALPPGGDFYLGYVDGKWPNYADVVLRFPAVPVVSVTTDGLHDAEMIDVERGDATPAGARAWIEGGAAGRLVYSSVATKPELDQALAGIEWVWCAADWTGRPHLVPGSLATQWASTPTYDVWESIDFGSNPQPQQEATMIPPTGTTDQQLFYACVRLVWGLVRTDAMGPTVQGALWWAWHVSPAQGGFGGDPDLWLARIIDDATLKGVRSVAFANAV